MMLAVIVSMLRISEIADIPCCNPNGESMIAEDLSLMATEISMRCLWNQSASRDGVEHSPND